MKVDTRKSLQTGSATIHESGSIQGP